MKISPARAAAFDILYRVGTEKAFSSVLLPFYEEKLSSKDRGLCHELTLGVLRRQIYLDAMISEFAKGKKLDASVQIALRLGLYQLLFLEKIPAYSAINDSVNLVQRAKKSSAKGLVNAVLRRATRETIELTYEDETDRISVETSHPRWLVKKWQGQFGLDLARDLAEVNNRPPQIAFRFTANAKRPEFAAILSGIRSKATPSAYVEGCYIWESHTQELSTAAADGMIYFQDEGSQMVGRAVTLRPGARFLDVCAAPGSKTTQIAAEADGTTIIAGDRYRPRVEFLRGNCRRQGVADVDVVQYDAEEALPFAEASFDVVLVDAPCSGTGTVRHNPEIRYFLVQNDLEELSRKQLQIVRNASKLVKPGGRLIYSTCSLEVEENEQVVEHFLGLYPGFALERAIVPDKFLSESGSARTFPPRDNMDGFFIAALKRQD